MEARLRALSRFWLFRCFPLFSKIKYEKVICGGITGGGGQHPRKSLFTLKKLSKSMQWLIN